MIATRFSGLADRKTNQDESRTRPMPNDSVQLRPPRRLPAASGVPRPKTQNLHLSKKLDPGACVIDVSSVLNLFLWRGQPLSVSASTPGNFLPPRNSSDAPPPVEMCEILSANPAWWIAATESPPPTIEVAPRAVAAATARAISSVPFANAGISNTPIGPFHTIVFARASSALNFITVSGPMSRSEERRVG